MGREDFCKQIAKNSSNGHFVLLEMFFAFFFLEKPPNGQFITVFVGLQKNCKIPWSFDFWQSLMLVEAIGDAFAGNTAQKSELSTFMGFQQSELAMYMFSHKSQVMCSDHESESMHVGMKISHISLKLNELDIS